MTSSTERAVLAGGCFWGMQDLIRKYEGVISTRVGYTCHFVRRNWVLPKREAAERQPSLTT